MLNQFANRALHFATVNSPAILTALGVAGLGTTSYLSFKAGVEHERIMQVSLGHPDAPWNREERDMTRKEVFEQTWETFVPPVVTGATTAVAIVMAHRIGANRAAAVATAFAVAERTIKDYRAKTVEVVGPNKAQKIHDAVQQDRVTNHPTASTMVVTAGKILCMDGFTGRVFEIDSLEDAKRAQNNLNHQLTYEDTQSLSDFYDRMGWEHVSQSDNLGWSMADGLMELVITTTRTKDDRPCFVLNYSPEPSPFRRR